ncbi:MAG TPA: helix-turn-helix domain-containing protein [Patescibacteria group bacterium]|nr:helix-turn-helix domain-containing protein [Patescibacteria group bacterium]
MAKYDLRLKARALRKQGVSVKQISKELEVSKGTASIWVRDIILTVEQLERLRMSELKGAELGRLRGALIQKERRIKLAKDLKNKGLVALKDLSKREILILGLALYWGEGNKKNRRIQFCNSDPDMIKFILYWLQKCFGVNKKDIKCTIGINEIHAYREQILLSYWSEITDIPLGQFSKNSYKKVLNKKVYENMDQYFGTLSINVCKGIEHFYTINGLIEAMREICSEPSIIDSPR